MKTSQIMKVVIATIGLCMLVATLVQGDALMIQLLIMGAVGCSLFGHFFYSKEIEIQQQDTPPEKPKVINIEKKRREEEKKKIIDERKKLLMEEYKKKLESIDEPEQEEQPEEEQQEEEPEYKCNECEQPFTSKTALFKHLKEVHYGDLN